MSIFDKFKARLADPEVQKLVLTDTFKGVLLKIPGIIGRSFDSIDDEKFEKLPGIIKPFVKPFVDRDHMPLETRITQESINLGYLGATIATARLLTGKGNGWISAGITFLGYMVSEYLTRVTFPKRDKEEEKEANAPAIQQGDNKNQSSLDTDARSQADFNVAALRTTPESTYFRDRYGRRPPPEPYIISSHENRAPSARVP